MEELEPRQFYEWVVAMQTRVVFEDDWNRTAWQCMQFQNDMVNMWIKKPTSDTYATHQDKLPGGNDAKDR